MGLNIGISAISSWLRNGTKYEAQHHVNVVVLGFFFVMLRGFFEDKTACVLFTFLCHIDTPPSAHHGNCTSSEQKMNAFSV